MSNDPWKHRSNGMRCATCMWFVVKSKPEGEPQGPTATNNDNGMLGRCRKHAPSMKGFVPVFEQDWCGDHRLDENKI